MSKILKDMSKVEQLLTKMKVNCSSIEEYENLLQSTADKMSLLVSSDEDLMARYRQNLNAFEQHFPDIHEFYRSYSPSKYIVDTKDGFVNAIDVNTGDHFYEYPSFLSTQLQFEQFKKSPNIKKFNFNSAEDNEANFVHVDCLESMNKLLHDKNSLSTNEEKPLPKHLSTLMIFGVAAGYHLEMFAHNNYISCLYIIEPDLDLFFLSLFSVNWQNIFDTFAQKGTRVHISLGEQEQTFFDEILKECGMSGRYQMSHVAGYIHYQSDAISKILVEFNKRYLELGRGWGFFDDAVMSIGHMLGNLKQNVPLLKKEAIDNNEFFETPVFIVGNGPSLDQLVDSIKKFQGKAIVISCGSALSALYQYGIIPDFHCEQERTFPVAEKIEHYCPKEFLESIVLLAPNSVHPAVFAMFKRSIMAAKANEPSSALLLRDIQGKELFTSYHFINPTVANTALAVGYNLGFKNFYLFGVDLGHKKDGLHHSKKSLYYNDDEQDRELYDEKFESSIEVEGNFGGRFICDTFFKQSNLNLSRQILGYKDLNCFNLSDGAKVSGSQPLTIIELENKFTLHQEIKKTEIIDNVYVNSVYLDKNGELFNRLVLDLDYQFFDDVCDRLLKLLDIPVTSFNGAIEMLSNTTILLRLSSEHIHDLLNGTLMHIQVTLNQLLYAGADEAEAIDLFCQGMAFYREFLLLAPKHYREHAEQAHFIEDCKWIRKLRNDISS